jgi:hypothetical protein
MRIRPLLLALAACAPQIDVTRPEDAPTGAILVPGEGTTVPSGPIQLRGQVADTETDPDHLFVVWSLGNATSDADGTWRTACDGFADADGATLCVTEIDDGDTRVRMVVTDLAGFRHQEVVDVVVDPIDVPAVTLEAPTGERLLYAGIPFPVVASVVDGDDDPTTLIAAWEDDPTGSVTGPTHPDAAGRLEGAITLPVGAHRLIVTVTDPGGAHGTDEVEVEVVENHAPTARIEAPTAAAVPLGVPLSLVGRALDADVAPGALAFAWTSDLDGDLGGGTPTDDGVARVDDVVLSAGLHALVLTVTDDAGVATEATLDLKVGRPPEVAWSAPGEGATVDASSGVSLEGTASDDETPAEALAVTVRVDGGPVVVTTHPAADGTIAVRVAGIRPGEHTLTLAVTDADGLVDLASRSVTITLSP